MNNAGISDAGQPAIEADLDMRRVYETNVFGVVAVTNAFLPALWRPAHPRRQHFEWRGVAGLGHQAEPAVPLPDGRNSRGVSLLERRL